MQENKHRQSIRILVWILIGTTIITTLVFISGGYIVLTDISRRNEQVRVEVEQNQRDARQLETIVAQLRSETLKLFYEWNTDNQLVTIVQRYPGIIIPLLERLDDDEKIAEFMRCNVQLNILVEQANSWMQHQQIIHQELIRDKEQAAVRGHIQRLRSFANIHSGQQRLSDAIDIRNWRSASGEKAVEIAAKILEKRGERWFFLLNEINIEVSNLSQQTEMLIGATNGSQLADVRDNMLKPSIEHLEHNFFILEDVLGKSATQAQHELEDLKIALFGTDYRIDEQLQTIIASGGLYQLIADRLTQQEDRLQLEKSLHQQYMVMENITTHAALQSQQQYAALSLSAQKKLHAALFSGKAGGVLVLLVTGGLGWVISRRLQHQVQELAILQRHNELILHAAGDGIIGLDAQGYATFVNPAASSMLGYESDEMMGEVFTNLLPVMNEDGEPLSHTDHPINRSLRLGAGQTTHSSSEFFQRRDGSTFCAQYVSTPLLDSNNSNEGSVLVFKDISEQQLDKKRLLQKKERLNFLANHDVLTGLPNRRLFREKLHWAIEQSRRTGSELAIFFIDLDRFKKINDSLGHEVGDMLLRAVAMRLQKSISPDVTLARLGGDEFVLLMEEITVVDTISEEAHQLLQAMNHTFELDGHRLFVSASVGISRFPYDAKDETTLMSNADVAMYYAKSHGKNNFQFYTPDMNARARELQELEIKLRDGIDNEQFVLYYQPQLNIDTLKLSGVEVLIRWNHPELGLVSPLDFIPLAEESGLIVPIGEWVLHTACRQVQQWKEQGIFAVRVAVNISAVQFKNDIQSVINRVLDQSGLDGNLLELEITESMLMGDGDEIISLLHDLKATGIHFSVDDFGTGFSSLSYLKRLPVDKLKIDRSFISDVLSNSNDAAIAISVIDLGHNMKLEVIAEGVETVEQEQFLRQHGCNSVQGFLYAEPMPAEEFEQWLLAGATMDRGAIPPI